MLDTHDSVLPSTISPDEYSAGPFTYGSWHVYCYGFSNTPNSSGKTCERAGAIHWAVCRTTPGYVAQCRLFRLPGKRSSRTGPSPDPKVTISDGRPTSHNVFWALDVGTGRSQRLVGKSALHARRF